MKFIRQFCIILFISFLGEGMRFWIPLPIPASVYGLVFMLGALSFGILKVSHVRETAEFLIEIMPVMFIPAGVGLMESWGVLKPVCVPILLITLLTTIFVMGVTGRVTQGMIRKEKRKRERISG